jgi:hypothetical protein
MMRQVLLGTLFVAACSSATTPGTSPAPAPAPSGGATPKAGTTTSSGLEVARLGSGDLRFQVSRHDSLSLQYPTGSQMQVLDRLAWVRLLLTANDGIITIVLDSLRSPAGLPADSLRALDGLVWTGTMERGRVGALRPSRHAPLGEQLALPLVRDLLPVLPTTGAKSGSTWRDSTTNAQRVVGADLPMSIATEYHARDAAGRPELEVLGASRLSAKGTSAQFGQTIDIAASGTGQRTWRLSPAGQVTGAEGSDSLTLSLDVPSVGQTVPAIQFGRFTATRIPAAR